MLHAKTVHLAGELVAELLEEILAQELVLKRSEHACFNFVAADRQMVYRIGLKIRALLCFCVSLPEEFCRPYCVFLIAAESVESVGRMSKLAQGQSFTTTGAVESDPRRSRCPSGRARSTSTWPMMSATQALLRAHCRSQEQKNSEGQQLLRGLRAELTG